MAARGLGTRDLTLTIDGVQRKFEVSAVELRSDELDVDWLSFGDVQEGEDSSYVLYFEAAQDPGTADSLWNLMFDEAGTTVAAVLAPAGNSGPISPTNPAFGFDVTISKPSGTLLGGEVDKSRTNRFLFECEWVVDGGITRITTEPAP